MIESFKHKGLKKLYTEGKVQGVRQDQVGRITMILDSLDAAETIEELNLPAFRFHALQGYNPTRYSMKVSGNYRITFEWNNGQAQKIDLEDYH
ncbi:MAG: Killer protein [Alphaproteobacteria bacterium]|nr:MAG: Killer protein [Alphaproteobacteria bacterium]